MLRGGLIEEVAADDDQPAWRMTDAGERFALRITESVGDSQNGSSSADDAIGISSMSDSEMPCQPRIEEPSKPSPSSNASSPNALSGSVMCCQVPSRSQNLRSTIFACVSPAHSSAARGSAPLST